MCRKYNVFVMRQSLFLFSTSLTTFTIGVIIAFPSVLNPAILDPNADINATIDQASWISACFGISSVPALAVIPSIFDKFGRKTTNIITNVAALVGCIIQYGANDIYSLAISRLFQGISIPGLDIISYGLTECTSPKRRGYFIVLNKLSVGIGSLACHSLALVLNWRQIAILSTIPLTLSIILNIYIKESPSYFAFQGKFDKCVKSFEWYRGQSLNSKKELKEFVTAQSANFRMKQREKHTSVFKKARNMLISKDFRKSFFIVLLAKLSLDLCGSHFIVSYITQILLKVTNSQSIAKYLSVVSDLIFISAFSISCILVKHFSRRALFFNLGCCSAFLMFIVSLCIILQNIFTILHLKWLTSTFILLQLFVSHTGLVPIIFTLCGEVFSLDHRGIGLFLSGIVSLSFFTLVLKLTPFMLEMTGVEGLYSISGICLLICLFIMRVILLETKDKTLQQIEDELKGKVRDKSEIDLLNFTN